MKLVKVGSRGAERLLKELEGRRVAASESVLPAVRKIVADVRSGGDAALRRYAVKFDGASKQLQLRISREEMQKGWEETPDALKQALEVAAANIRAFAKRQMPVDWSFSPASGLMTGQTVRAVEAAGCYVPSGRYPLPSTLLMTVIPAQVAGVSRIVVVSPRPARETLAAAWMLGVEHFYRIGGAQAVAALAYGTESLPRVDKIVGPGNLYVTAAKKLVAFDCSIDMLAGPTEIVVTSEKGNAAAIASDMVAQAEHDPEALALFVTTADPLAKNVIDEVSKRAKANSIARQSLRKNGFVLLAPTVEVAREITNRLAPEHLTIDSDSDLKWVRNAGSVFVGRYSPQPMGDYVSGPNHTLPTGTMARVRGGLSVLDFLKVITVQRYTRDGLRELGPAAIALAEAEGLKGHAEAIRARGVRG
ncbi:MAG TPA: histidinol dehydrogenase [Acidisarcina sp.]|nr:histidinol dehydrogenase [Acidisarcina sp.]